MRVTLLLLSALVALNAYAASEPYHVPEQLFAGEPRGPYQTGTFEELWVDEQRDDPSTAAKDQRKLMVQVWYPAVFSGKPRRAPYALQPGLYAAGSLASRAAGVETQSVIDAAVVSQPQRLPVLIYSHGRELPQFSATFQTEFLASHGYVVVAVGHSGVNGIERFPDGTAYREDGVRYSAQYGASTVLTEAEQKLSSRDQFELIWARADLSLYVQDVRFVLDRLAVVAADRRHRLCGRLDLERVGALGWSLGGIVAFQATRTEPRIKAAANFDGWPFGWLGANGVVTQGSPRPLLLMNGMWGGLDTSEVAIDAGDRELAHAAETYYWTMLRRSTADWYRVNVNRASHLNFSDLPLFEPEVAEDINPRLAHRIVNNYTLEFFDKYLRGSEATPLLEGTRKYPEARLLRKLQ
ncbi:alpha/beta hydrolase family protein [Steroidobacter sp.]|uniref:alpha/beta hydrolase family protein n=1 Tax=Steroidobacter sp. TaxID=1978227 RepID=UPI001A62376F|nr:hypothetical protein [Steroidobacter sp.]MBL8265827.1 hypothetical protein [Steroidobacter sp.]